MGVAAAATRAMEVPSVMAQGYNNQAIADQLTIALRTVENYIHQIYCTLSIDDDQDVSPRVQAAPEYFDFRLWGPAEKNWN